MGVDAISGATVTVIAQNQVMMHVWASVARGGHLLQPVVRTRRFAETGGRRWTGLTLGSKAWCSGWWIQPSRWPGRRRPNLSSNCGLAT